MVAGAWGGVGTWLAQRLKVRDYSQGAYSTALSDSNKSVNLLYTSSQGQGYEKKGRRHGGSLQSHFPIPPPIPGTLLTVFYCNRRPFAF